jgi:Mg2+/Co2+ transporter CorC
VDLVTKKMLLLSGEESHLFTTEDLLEVISGDIENEGA